MWLYGASGHGKVIKDILEAQGRTVDGFVDDNPDINELAGLPVLHGAEKADEVIARFGESKLFRLMNAERWMSLGRSGTDPRNLPQFYY